jgi:hypothetical protein
MWSGTCLMYLILYVKLRYRKGRSRSLFLILLAMILGKAVFIEIDLTGLLFSCRINEYDQRVIH